jgi:hypothetical protein
MGWSTPGSISLSGPARIARKARTTWSPYWIFDTKGGYKIERQIPLLPLSREIGQLAWLKKTLVAYRSVIGQPRQEELTEFLLRRMAPERLAAFTEACTIDLSPPSRRSRAG